MPIELPPIEFSGQPEISKFTKARATIASAITHIPTDLQPPIDVESTDRIYFCDRSNLRKLNILYYRALGFSDRQIAELELIPPSGTLGSCIHETVQIAILKFPKSYKDNPNIQGMHEKHAYGLILSHELAHLLVHYAIDISIDSAQAIIGMTIDDALNTEGLKSPVEVIQIDQYGRQIDLWLRDACTGRPLPHFISEISRNNILTDIFCNAYMQYIDFIAFCIGKSVDFEYMNRNPEYRRSLISQYAESPEFRSTIKPDTIELPFTLLAAYEFEGYENLLRFFLIGLDNPLFVDFLPISNHLAHITALSSLFHTYFVKMKLLESPQNKRSLTLRQLLECFQDGNIVFISPSSRQQVPISSFTIDENDLLMRIFYSSLESIDWENPHDVSRLMIDTLRVAVRAQTEGISLS